MSLIDAQDVMVLRGTPYKTVAICLWTFFLIVGLSMAAGHSLGDRLLGGGIAVIAAGLIVRSVRACVIVSAVGVELRTPWRTHRLALEEVASARVVPMNTLGLFSAVCVVLRSGSRIRVDGVGSWRRNGDPNLTEVGRVVSEINRRIGTQPRSIDSHVA